MTDPTLIADLIRAGVDPDLIGRVANAIAAAAVSAKSADCPVDKTAEKRRAYDRERRRNERMSGGSPRTSAESASAPLKEERKREEGALDESGGQKRAKGTRLEIGWKPSEADLEFALSRGMPKPRVEIEAEKFRNYWTAKPGRAATKLDWSATWRNWILQSLDRTPPPNAGVAGGRDDWRKALV